MASQIRRSGAAAFSQDGELIAVADGHAAIGVRRSSDLGIVRTLRGSAPGTDESDKNDENDEVRLLFAPDKRSLLSYSRNDSGAPAVPPVVRLWDVMPRAAPATPAQALRTLCRLPRYQPEWRRPESQSVRDTCDSAVRDVPDAGPPNGAVPAAAGCRQAERQWASRPPADSRLAPHSRDVEAEVVGALSRQGQAW